MANASSFPKSFGLLLFPQFAVLDAAGPIQCLNSLTIMKDEAGGRPYKDLTLSIVAKTMDPVDPGPIAPDTLGINFTGRQAYPPTHTFDNAPPLDVLIVPGGLGTISPLPGGGEPDLDSALEFIKNSYNGSGSRPPVQYIFSICTGSALLAKAGILDGRKATSNKARWNVVTPEGPKTNWVAKARWVEDGNIWTTSGVSAGTDGMLAWMEKCMGAGDMVEKVATLMEYTRAKSSDEDPFADVWGAKDVIPK